MSLFKTILSNRMCEIALIIVASTVMVGLGLIVALPVQASSNLVTQNSFVSVDDEACLSCHGTPDQTLTFANGDQVSISIDVGKYVDSTHSNLTCTTCHTNIAGFPHPELTAQDKRDYTLQYKDNCAICHKENAQLFTDSVHNKALSSGNKNAAVCSDCHNPHTQKIVPEKKYQTAEERRNIAETCAHCHSTIFNEYSTSVHGSAVVKGDNLDVPTCVDCHSPHVLPNPLTASFRLSSVELCAKCHTNPSIMNKYGISTDVLNTYVADFHGTTVTLFEKQSPDEATNKPVCYDCHGVHNIKAPNDPQGGLEIKQNLLVTCRKCHPDASTNFPNSWLSHYIPSKEHYPVVYYVQQFYRVLIPTVLGGMAVFVVSDIIRRLIEKKTSQKKGETA